MQNITETKIIKVPPFCLYTYTLYILHMVGKEAFVSEVSALSPTTKRVTDYFCATLNGRWNQSCWIMKMPWEPCKSV